VKRATGVALIGLLVCAVETQAQTNLGFRGYVTFGPTYLSATETFDAVAGKSSENGIGFGGSLDNIWKGLFIDVGLSKLKIDGERVFVFEGTVFPLDIPLTIEMRPIDVIVGWRHTAGRWRPYGGGGISLTHYTERSPFAESGDDVDVNEMGLAFLGGVDFTATPWLGIGAEVRYRRITGILGAGGVSQEFGEDQLGGVSFAARVSVGRLIPPAVPSRAPAPAAEPRPPVRAAPLPQRPAPAPAGPIPVPYPAGQTTVAWQWLTDSAIHDAADVAPSLDLNDSTPRGFSVTTTANYRPWFGATTEITASFWTGEAVDLIQRWTLMVGPTFIARQNRVRPFGQVLVGAAYSRGGIPDLGLSFEGWDFALQPGGGVEVAMSPRLGLRASIDGRLLSDEALSGKTTTQWRFTLGVTFFHGGF
jgi:opacity protein-like surface antigen